MQVAGLQVTGGKANHPALLDCLASHGIRMAVTYQPASRPPWVGVRRAGSRSVTKVTDAGGRSFTIAYFTKATARKPQIRGVTTYTYDDVGRAPGVRLVAALTALGLFLIASWLRWGMVRPLPALPPLGFQAVAANTEGEPLAGARPPVLEPCLDDLHVEASNVPASGRREVGPRLHAGDAEAVSGQRERCLAGGAAHLEQATAGDQPGDRHDVVEERVRIVGPSPLVQVGGAVERGRQRFPITFRSVDSPTSVRPCPSAPPLDAGGAANAEEERGRGLRVRQSMLRGRSGCRVSWLMPGHQDRNR
jgi:hypothetical protein